MAAKGRGPKTARTVADPKALLDLWAEELSIEGWFGPELTFWPGLHESSWIGWSVASTSTASAMPHRGSCRHPPRTVRHRGPRHRAVGERRRAGRGDRGSCAWRGGGEREQRAPAPGGR